MSELDTAELILLEQRVAAEAPSLAVAYLFAFFLGLVSGHRFYLRRPGTAILQIVSYFVLVGFVWWFIDLFLIPGMVAQDRARIRQRELANLTRYRPEHVASPAQVDAALVSSLLSKGPSA
jgi:hypothetical protein